MALPIETYLDFVQQSTPATPPAGRTLIYAKADGKVYRLGSDGVETELAGGGGGGSIGPISAGTETDALAFTGAMDAQSVGLDTDALVMSLSSSSLTVGADTAAFLSSNAAGSGAEPVGTGTDTLAMASGSEAGQPVGTDADTLAASVISNINEYTTGASSSGGTPWTNPGNANGVGDNVNATLAAAAGANSNATLTLPSHNGGTGPGASYTRGLVQLLLRSQMDTTVGLTDTVSFVVNAMKADGTGSFVVYTSTGTSNTRNDGALVNDNFDVTTATAGWTDAECIGMKCTLVATWNLTAAIGGNIAWNVDRCYRNITWSKAALP